MTTIPIQINEADLSKIDFLVKIGRYKNRSQAIKSMLQDKLAHEAILLDFEDPNEELRRQELLQQFKKEYPNKKLIVTIFSDKNSAEMISEERDR